MTWQAAHWGSGTNIVLHEWWLPTGEWIIRIAYMGMTMLPGAALIFLATAIPSGANMLLLGIVVGLIFTLMGLSAMYASATPRWLSIRKLATKDGFVRLLSGLACGLFMGLLRIGLGVLMGGSLETGLPIMPFCGLMGGLVGFAAARRNDDPAEVAKPRETIRNDGVAGLVLVFAFGLVCAPLLAGAVASASMLTAWFVFVFALAVAIGTRIAGGAWMRYHFAVIIGWVRGRGPLRFGKFLDWGVEAGLLRISGVSYQFRHRQLQDWLTSPDSQETRDAAA